MLHFDPKTGLYADEVETVRESVRQDWRAAFARDGLPPLDVEPETPAGQLIDSQTAAIADKDSELLFLANQFNPLTAEGVWQDALGKIYFLSRQLATPSEATCLCSGLGGTVIPRGAVIKSSVDGARWVCAGATTIPDSGETYVRFMSGDAGAITADAGTLTEIVTVIPGWDAVINPEAAITGGLPESQREFETRRYNSVAKNARGSLSAIYGALADIKNVIDVVVLENTGNDPVVKWGATIPGHSIYVSIVGGDDAEIAETIYRKKDAGCGTAGNTALTWQDMDMPGNPVYTYYIERPEPVEFGIRVTIGLTDATPADIRRRIVDALIADFNGLGPHGNLRIGAAQDVYASRFYCPVIESGARKLASIEISFPYNAGEWADNVAIPADQTPVLDSANISIVIKE